MLFLMLTHPSRRGPMSDELLKRARDFAAWTRAKRDEGTGAAFSVQVLYDIGADFQALAALIEKQQEALEEIHLCLCGCDEPGRLDKCVAQPVLAFRVLSTPEAGPPCKRCNGYGTIGNAAYGTVDECDDCGGSGVAEAGEPG